MTNELEKQLKADVLEDIVTALNIYTMDSWLASKNIDLKEVTRYM